MIIAIAATDLIISIVAIEIIAARLSLKQIVSLSASYYVITGSTVVVVIMAITQPNVV